ncbi:hypothetical protein M405DRAFT_382704 [Rhizopogon salebrosus TDB-379]|nr:hypothetical protein M405DRAFT_382704 [Rhizopogon salebrosus TDB-379]
MSNTLRINCLVSGESTEQIFIVKIESAKTISDLKKSIKEEVWAFRNRYIELLQVSDLMPTIWPVMPTYRRYERSMSHTMSISRYMRRLLRSLPTR